MSKEESISLAVKIEEALIAGESDPLLLRRLLLTAASAIRELSTGQKICQ